MKSILLVFALCTLHFSVISQNPTILKEIQFSELAAIVESTPDIQLIDVRSIQEFESGHIQGAKHISISNKGEFAAQIRLLDREQPLYLYCHSGVRSKRAAAIITSWGFKEIYDFTGGWSTWKKLKQY